MKSEPVSAVSLRDHASAAAEFHRLFGRGQTFGDRLSDKVAAVGGSWSFIIVFSIFLIAWTSVNTFVLARHAFDPYPIAICSRCEHPGISTAVRRGAHLSEDRTLVSQLRSAFSSLTVPPNRALVT